MKSVKSLLEKIIKNNHYDSQGGILRIVAPKTLENELVQIGTILPLFRQTFTFFSQSKATRVYQKYQEAQESGEILTSSDFRDPSQYHFAGSILIPYINDGGKKDIRIVSYSGDTEFVDEAMSGIVSLALNYITLSRLTEKLETNVEFKKLDKEFLKLVECTSYDNLLFDFNEPKLYLPKTK